MLDSSIIDRFDKIYSTDLVYVKDCWKLCGDAHCCNFNRYKSQFTMIGRKYAQELPLLPGEHEYLEHRGFLEQFKECEHKVVDYALDLGAMKLEFMMGASKDCACSHDTRTTVCRLYPLLPVFDIDGRLVGVDPTFGIFEEVEAVDHLERACRVTSIPIQEIGKYAAICAEIGRDPKAVFYAMAYRLTRQHARAQLERARAKGRGSALLILEQAFLLRRLLDQDFLKSQLNALAGRFRQHYGERFTLD
jgi:hypothetical protein